MLKLNTSTQFKKDYKTCIKRHYKMDLCKQLLMYCECLTHCHKRTETTALLLIIERQGCCAVSVI